MMQKIPPPQKNAKQPLIEFVRFGIVGAVATAIHYLIYYLLQRYISAAVSYTAGYVLSFAVNFLLTSLFTFRTRATVLRGVGFCVAHLCNYLLQMLLLLTVLRLGIDRTLAPLPVYCVCIPVNFLMVRFVFKHIGQ